MMKFTQEWESHIRQMMAEKGISRKSAVQNFRRSQKKGLTIAPSRVIPLADTKLVDSGCKLEPGDKTVADCQSKFNNAIDFKGEPVIPEQEPIKVEIPQPASGTSVTVSVPKPSKEKTPGKKRGKPAKQAPAGFDVDAAFAKARELMRDPKKDKCKHGHPITAANANLADLQRMGKYCCDPCIKLYAEQRQKAKGKK